MNVTLLWKTALKKPIRFSVTTSWHRYIEYDMYRMLRTDSTTIKFFQYFTSHEYLRALST